MDDVSILLRALQSAFGFYGVTYLATAIFAPAWFLDRLAINHIERRSAIKQRQRNVLSPTEPWYLIPAALLTWAAVGVVIYAAAYAIVAIIPYDWGSHNEEGEWESLRWSIQFGSGLIGGVALAIRLEKNAEILVWGPSERKARQAMTAAIQSTKGVTPEIMDRVLSSIHNELEPESQSGSSFERGYMSDLRRWIGISQR